MYKVATIGKRKEIDQMGNLTDKNYKLCQGVDRVFPDLLLIPCSLMSSPW